jgi:phosphoribosylanthranilate isomerase
MIVQIYTMQSPDEALAVARLGVDHLGVTPSNCGLPGELDYDAARAICEAAPEGVKTVALSIESDLDAIVNMVQAVRPDILHLCGPRGATPPAAVRTLRERLPGVEIMQAISVSGLEALDDARSYYGIVDYLLLDTQAPDIGGIGASGATHDWNISRAIVADSPVPVILAGGLTPDNVAEAIRTVRPWGVDSLTHTNRPLPGGGFVKDLDKIRAFVAAAKQVILT